MNLRTILGVPKLESTKARAFIAKGLLCRYAADSREQQLAEARSHLSWLVENATTEFSGMGWANAFDFASRGGFFPAGLPTVVWTAHAAEAFDAAHRLTGEREFADVVRSAGKFVFEALEVHEDDDGVCIGYAPGRLNLVHNSNLLGAVTLLRATRLGAPEVYRERAGRAISWSVNRIDPAGGWRYGEGPQYAWIDNFHTGYVLDCLCDARALAASGTVPDDVIERTYNYWRRTFIEEEGRPRYYSDRTYPIDIQCCAQAIETSCRVAGTFTEAGELAERVAGWTLRHMLKHNGAFRYRRGRVFSNNLESLHWGQGTMLSALGHLALLHEKGPQAVEGLYR